MVHARILYCVQFALLHKNVSSGLASENKNNFGLKIHSTVSDAVVCHWHTSSFILLKF